MSDRDAGGRIVREAWICWAEQQPYPKPSWLVPYDELSEDDKEADRQIYEAVIDSLAPTTGSWIAAEDVHRLVRQIDVALNGEEGAAKQAMLCDITAQVVAEARKRGGPLLLRNCDCWLCTEATPAYRAARLRAQQADAYTAAGMKLVRETPPPKGQKFPPGARVRIVAVLPSNMRHFPADRGATVLHTYKHAFGGSDERALRIYALDVDGIGHVAWYDEDQLFVEGSEDDPMLNGDPHDH